VLPLSPSSPHCTRGRSAAPAGAPSCRRPSSPYLPTPPHLWPLGVVAHPPLCLRRAGLATHVLAVVVCLRLGACGGAAAASYACSTFSLAVVAHLTVPGCRRFGGPGVVGRRPGLRWVLSGRAGVAAGSLVRRRRLGGGGLAEEVGWGRLGVMAAPAPPRQRAAGGSRRSVHRHTHIAPPSGVEAPTHPVPAVCFGGWGIDCVGATPGINDSLIFLHRQFLWYPSSVRTPSQYLVSLFFWSRALLVQHVYAGLS